MVAVEASPGASAAKTWITLFISGLSDGRWYRKIFEEILTVLSLSPLNPTRAALFAGTFNLATGMRTSTKLFETSRKVKALLVALLATLFGQIILTAFTCQKELEQNTSSEVTSPLWIAVLELDLVLPIIATAVISLAFYEGLIRGSASAKNGVRWTLLLSIGLCKAAEVGSLILLPLAARSSPQADTRFLLPYNTVAVLACAFLLLELVILFGVLVVGRERLNLNNNPWQSKLSLTKIRLGFRILLASSIIPFGLLVAAVAVLSPSEQAGVAHHLTLFAQFQVAAAIAAVSLTSKVTVHSQASTFHANQRSQLRSKESIASLKETRIRMVTETSQPPLPSLEKFDLSKSGGPEVKSKSRNSWFADLKGATAAQSVLHHRRRSTATQIQPIHPYTAGSDNKDSSTNLRSPIGSPGLGLTTGSDETRRDDSDIDGAPFSENDSKRDKKDWSSHERAPVDDDYMATIKEESNTSHDVVRDIPVRIPARARAWSRSAAFVFPRSRGQNHVNHPNGSPMPPAFPAGSFGGGGQSGTYGGYGDIIGAYMEATRDTIRSMLPGGNARSRDQDGARIKPHCPPHALCEKCRALVGTSDALTNFDFEFGLPAATDMTLNGGKYDVPSTTDVHNRGGSISTFRPSISTKRNTFGLDGASIVSEAETGVVMSKASASNPPVVPSPNLGNGFDAASLLNITVCNNEDRNLVEGVTGDETYELIYGWQPLPRSQVASTTFHRADGSVRSTSSIARPNSEQCRSKAGTSADSALTMRGRLPDAQDSTLNSFPTSVSVNSNFSRFSQAGFSSRAEGRWGSTTPSDHRPSTDLSSRVVSILTVTVTRPSSPSEVAHSESGSTICMHPQVSALRRNSILQTSSLTSTVDAVGVPTRPLAVARRGTVSSSSPPAMALAIATTRRSRSNTVTINSKTSRPSSLSVPGPSKAHAVRPKFIRSSSLSVVADSEPPAEVTKVVPGSQSKLSS
ncbi:hypothetical protein CF327_g4889 [Tilletia walkeri]|nr:hypothetical protein CF327_g4889 [Tilletia walkeri]